MAHITILSKEIRTLDGLYSLNDLHKAAGAENKHRPSLFIANAQTKALIQEIEQSSNSCFDGNDQNSNLGLGLKTLHGGRNGGTYVCKELVYAYAMWISPKFNLQVIRAFDQAQAAPSHDKADSETEAEEKALTTPFVDEDKLKLLNSIAQSMGFNKTVAVVSAADMMGLFRLLREYQTCAEHFAQLQTHTDWLNETIQHVKNTTGRHFGEG